MAFRDAESDPDKYERLLSEIAMTEPWEFPEEFTRFKEALDDQVAVMDRSRDVLMEPGVFECSAREKAVECSDAIVRYLRNADLDRQFADLRDRIDSHNQAIYDARSVWLPGDRLDDVSVRRIMDATEPLDLVVPGLGTVAGVVGVAGVNLVSRMLAGHREEVARQEYDRIIKTVDRSRFDPELPPAPDVNGIWPQPGAGSGSGAASVPGPALSGGSSGLRGTWSGVPAGRGVTEYGVPLPPGVAGAAGGAAAASAGREGVASRRADHDQRGVARSDGRADTRDADRATRHGYDGPRHAGPAGYRDPAADTDGTRRSGTSDSRRAGDMAVDGGMDGVWDAGAGRTALTAGAGMGVGAGGMLAARRMTAGAGGVGAGSGVSAVPGAGVGSLSVSSAAGAGSYYANTPVRASVVSSSIKGATGMAAGLRKGELARAAAAEAGASGRNATPGLMGAGRGGASDKKARRRNTMGYIAPTIEEDEEFTPKPLAAMAGHLKNLDK